MTGKKTVSHLSGITLKILDKEQQMEGEKLLEEHTKKEFVELSMVGIIEEGTANGNTGVVFVFQREGIPEYYVASTTGNLFKMIHGGLIGAEKRFLENKQNG